MVMNNEHSITQNVNILNGLTAAGNNKANVTTKFVVTLAVLATRYEICIMDKKYQCFLALRLLANTELLRLCAVAFF